MARTTLGARARIGGPDPHQIEGPPSGLGKIVVVVVAVVLMTAVVVPASATPAIGPVVAGHGSGWEK